MDPPHEPLDPEVLSMLRRLSPPGGTDVLGDVLQLFQADVLDRLAALEVALEAGNLIQTERTAHAIKGAAGNIGARDLFAACEAAEDAARGGGLADARAACDELRVECRRVLDTIRDLLGGVRS